MLYEKLFVAVLLLLELVQQLLLLVKPGEKLVVSQC